MKLSLVVLLLLGLTVTQCQWELLSTHFDDIALQPSDLAGWELTGFENNNFLTQCERFQLVGGYGSAAAGAILGKQIDNLPSHYKLKIEATVFFLDTWDNEFFQVLVDGQVMAQEQSHQGFHGYNICSNSHGTGDRIYNLQAEFGHDATSMKLEFTSTLNQISTDESWGIRDVRIYIKRCGDDCHHEVHELQQDMVEAEAESWVVLQNTGVTSTLAEGNISDCEGFKMLGGFKKFGKGTTVAKEWENLPSHYKAVMQFRLWQLDSWDGNESVYIKIDGRSQYQYKKTMGVGGSKHSCGVALEKDIDVWVTIELPHSGSTFSLEMYDTLNEQPDNESWGISDLDIYFIECGEGCTEVASEMNETSFSSDDVSGWIDTQNNNTPFNTVTACGLTSMLGGYNALSTNNLQKTWTDLPAHSSIIIGLELWLIDTWDANDKILFLADLVPVQWTQQKSGFNQLAASGNGCGASNYDEAQLIWIEFPHSSSTLEFQIWSYANEAANNESYGFRDLHIYTINDNNIGKEVATSLTGAITEEETAKWTIGGNGVSAVTNCRGMDLFGGFNKFGQGTVMTRKFDNLPEHNTITIQFKLAFLDTWDGNDTMDISVDGVRQQSITKFYDADFRYDFDLCTTGAANDDYRFVQVQFTHSDSSATINIFDNLNEAKDNESWGVNEFHLFTSFTQRAMPDCPTLYSACNYQGESFNLCENTANFEEVDWTTQVHSVWVPEGWTATLYDDVDYQGKSHEFTESAACLENGPNFQFIRIQQLRGLSGKQQLQKHEVRHVEMKKSQKSHKAHLRNNKL